MSVFWAVGNNAKDWTRYGLVYKENWGSFIIDGLLAIFGFVLLVNKLFVLLLVNVELVLALLFCELAFNVLLSLYNLLKVW